MSAPSILTSRYEQILALFPFLARFRVRPKEDGGALEIKSAGQKIEMQGGGRPASGKGHLAFRIAYSKFDGNIYVSTDVSAPYAWTAVHVYTLANPTPADAGTPIYIAEGSGKVEIDG